MTVRVPRLPLTLDPLIAEAKRRMRRRRLLIAAVLVLAVAGTAGGVIAARSPAGAGGKVAGLSLPAGARSCGLLGVGIGWRVWAGSTLSCRSGRTFMREYLGVAGWPAAATFRGYACTFRVLPAGVGRFSCLSGKRAVVAVSNH
jgi:hypothetical protein